MNPTGGLLWHARAWRRQGAWRGTCGQIGQWLGEVRPISRELVIIGASAGWMMPSAWLQRFEKISTFDIDRWAAPLFRLRHGAVLRRSGVDLRCHTSDAIGRLDEVLAENPRAAVLFDNVLGQLRFLHASIDTTAACLDRVKRSVRRREWGSLHDAYSGSVRRSGGRLDTPSMHQSLQAKGERSAAQNPLGRLWPDLADNLRPKANGWTTSLRKFFPPAQPCTILPGITTGDTATGYRPAGWPPCNPCKVRVKK